MLKDNVKNPPNSPGVYHFLGESGEILYVGKAKNLKNRIRQYFLKELNRGPGIEQMVRLAANIDWVETDSEIEAILLEAEQINKLQPKYNIRQKDDKSFLAIKIAKNKLKVKSLKLKAGLDSGSQDAVRNDSMFFPCVELVRFRGLDIEDKFFDFFGPYPSGDMLKKSLRYLRKIFPFRDCSVSKWRTYQKKNRTCLYGDIGLCGGPCVGEINQVEYSKNIEYLKSFLRGKKKTIVRDLEKKMAALSREKNFEVAAEIRNKLLALNHLGAVRIGLRDDVFDLESILFERIECFDIANLGEESVVGSMVVFVEGKPEKSEYKKFKVKNKKLKAGGADTIPTNDLGRMEQVLTRRFKNDWPKPDLIIIDGGATHLAVAQKVLVDFGLSIPVISISKGPERKKNDFHFGDAATAEYFKTRINLQKVAIMARDEAHRFAGEYFKKLRSKKIFEK